MKFLANESARDQLRRQNNKFRLIYLFQTDDNTIIDFHNSIRKF